MGTPRGSQRWPALGAACLVLAACAGGVGGGTSAGRVQSPARRPAPLAAPSGSTAVAPAGSVAARPPARPPVSTEASAVPPLASPPRRALLVGDGVMYDAVPALEAALRAGGVAEVVAAPRFGMGLTRPEAYDWQTEWPRLMAATRPDLVVAMVGPWDVRTVEVAGRALAPGEPAWGAFYEALAGEAAGILTAGGARLVWVGMPLVGAGPDPTARVAALNAVLRRVAARHPRVTFVDAAGALAGPDGRFAPVQLDGTTPVRVMKPDGEHLCPAGAARLAAAVVAAVPLEAGTAWRDGPWRTDGRYRWRAGGGCPPPVAGGSVAGGASDTPLP